MDDERDEGCSDGARRIPDEMKTQLLNEVHFRCPLAGCASPYLEFHHFDPKWCDRVDDDHHSEGIIAICSEHHRKAAGLTKEELRELKKSPHHQRAEPLLGEFEWNQR